MNPRVRWRRFAATLVASAAPVLSPAHAQVAAAAEVAPAISSDHPVASDDGHPVAASPDQQNTADVVVTARRREERAQDVPIALSVVGDEQLAKSGDYTLTQVQQLVPSLLLSGGNARNTNINIRGLGSNAISNDGLELGVGFYLDDVYYGRVGQSQFDLVDLDHIEVLRGPQGTLFGKNTTAGAINITSKLPSFTTGFVGEADGGNYGYYQLRGSLTGPLIGDTVAYRLSIADTHHDGFLTNLYDGSHPGDYQNFSARGQLLIKPAPDLTLRLIGDYSKQKQHATVNSLVGFFPTFTNGTAISNNFLQRAARFNYTPLFDPFSRDVDADAPFQANMDGYGFSGRADWHTGGVTVTSITAYRWWDWYPLNDQDSTPLSVQTKGGTSNHQRQFSQELRVASDGSHRIDWVGGLYYFYQTIKGFGSYAFGPDAALWNYPTTNQHVTNVALDGFESDSWLIPTTHSYAAFGQATWKITDRLKLTGGLRFTHETKTGYFDQFTVAGQDLSQLSPADQITAQKLRDTLYPQVSYTAHLTNNNLSGTANLSYQLERDVLIYATYSRGAKSGGMSLGVLPNGVPATVRPETVNAYEIGVKSQFFDRKLTVNLAGYWDDVTDYQAAITQQVGDTTAFVRYIANIPSVRSRGVEGDLVFAPSRWVSLGASASYNDATYRDYPNAPLSPEQTGAPFQDLSGYPLADAPKFSYTLNADFSQPLTDHWSLYEHGDYAHRSSFYTSATDSIYSLIPAYDLLNARVGVRSEDGRWDVSVWAKNLTNEDYYVSLSAANTGLISGLLGDPRTFGGTVRFQF
jgi:iron complex outermembrane receptor protein